MKHIGNDSNYFKELRRFESEQKRIRIWKICARDAQKKVQILSRFCHPLNRPYEATATILCPIRMYLEWAENISRVNIIRKFPIAFYVATFCRVCTVELWHGRLCGTFFFMDIQYTLFASYSVTAKWNRWLFKLKEFVQVQVYNKRLIIPRTIGTFMYALFSSFDRLLSHMYVDKISTVSSLHKLSSLVYWRIASKCVCLQMRGGTRNEWWKTSPARKNAIITKQSKRGWKPSVYVWAHYWFLGDCRYLIVRNFSPLKIDQHHLHTKIAFHFVDFLCTQSI